MSNNRLILEVNPLLDDLLTGARAILGNDLIGLYLDGPQNKRRLTRGRHYGTMWVCRPRNSEDRVPASEAGCTGSSPVEGIDQ